MTLDTPVTTLAGETMQEAIPRWLERERRGHEAFARTRRRAYVENRGVLDRLDRYAAVTLGDTSAGRSRPLVVTGDSGAGKSALLAHWSERYRLDNPDRFIITHYVGATADSGDYTSLLRRIMLEIRERSGTIAEPPDDPEELVQRFPEWLSYIRDESIVIVVDAVNQLEEKLDEFPPLHWLPDDFPAHIRLIVSTLDGPLRRVMEARGWGMLTVEPLGVKERHEVARRFLGGTGALDSTQVRRLTQNRNSANPLYLRTSLEELRRVGDAADRTDEIDRYLEAADLDTLFDRVLERIESEYGVRLVSAIMRFLWGSRQGLHRDELLALSGVKAPRLGRLIGSLDYQLMERDGLLTFFHDHLRSAVRKRYVAGDRASRAIHRRLGAYFAARPVDRRRADEELWQWRNACAWDDLRHGLTDFPLFSYLYQGEKKHEVLRYWQAIPEDERRSMEEEYAATLGAIEESTTMAPLEKAEALETVAAFLTASAEHAEAERLYREALRLREEMEGTPDRAMVRTLTQLGTVLSTRGQFAEAEEKLREALRLIEGLAGPDSAETAEVVDALATLHLSFRNYRDAEPLYRRALAIRERTLGRRNPDTIMSLTNLGAAYFALDQVEEAHVLFTTAFELSEETLGSEHPQTSIHLNNLAMTLDRQEKHLDSISLLERAIEINTKIHGSRHPEIARNLLNLATANHKAGRIEEADTHYRRATEITSEIYGPIHPEVATMLVNYGTFLLLGRSDPESAEEIYRRAIAVRMEIFPHDHISIHDCWLNVALILMERGAMKESIDIYRRSLPIVDKSVGTSNPRIERMFGRFIRLLRATGHDAEAQQVEDSRNTTSPEQA